MRISDWSSDVCSSDLAFVAEVIDRHTINLRHLMRAIFLMTVTLTVLNTALILVVTGLAVVLWMEGLITVGAIAVAIGLIIRLTQMSGWILRTVTSLFENIGRSEEHTSELQSLMRISYAVFCLKKKIIKNI